MRLSILGLFTIALLVFASCQKSESNPDAVKMTDAELIEAIKNASDKQEIDLNKLPPDAKTILDKYYAEDIIEATKLAPALGYEVDLREGSGPRVAVYIQAYFDLEGKELFGDDGKYSEGGKDEGDDGKWRERHRKHCFELLLPVTYTMPDGTEITVAEKEDWALIKSWYEAHPDVKERPDLHFPVEVKYKDGNVVTVSSEEEMERLQQSCEGNQGGNEKCFGLVFPVTFEMPDGSTVTINNEEEMKAARMEWKENGIRPTLQFPVEIIFGDKLITVNSHEEMIRIKKACQGDNGHHGDKKRCFGLVYPVTFEMPDGSTVTINSQEEMKAAKIRWKEAGVRPTLQFPVDIKYKDGTIVTISSQEEMRAARVECGDDHGKKRCFELVLPVTYTMPDGTDIVIAKKEDRRLIKEWYIAHPDVNEKPALQFPVDIKYKDGTVVTINSEEELRAAREGCNDKD